MKVGELKSLLVCAIVFLMSIGTAVLGDWDPGDPYKMHHPQMPNPEGWDICVVDQWVADDFVCTESGKITDIHFWVSWRGDEVGDNMDLNPEISIWSDAGGQPGMELWKWNGVGQVTSRHYGSGMQGWACPSTGVLQPNDHQQYYQVNVTQIEAPFKQEADTVYWLLVKVNAPVGGSMIGWKTSASEPPGPIWGRPALWSPAPGVVAWQPVQTGPVLPTVHDMAFVITGEPEGPPPIERPTLRVGDWINPEPWHGWADPFGPIPVQFQAVDPCHQIIRVDFYYSLDGEQWKLFASDTDGTEPSEDTVGSGPNEGDGWTGVLYEPPQVSGESVPLLLKAEAWAVDSFFDVYTEVSLDPTPPDSVMLNVEDWQVVEEDELMVDVDPILADIQYVIAYAEPKPEEYKKGIPGISQQPHSRTHCAPTAAAACLKYFENQGDDEICGGLNNFDLVEALARLSGTNQGRSGTRPSDLANGLRNWIEDHGDGYTVRGPIDFDWQEVRDELERSQDVLVGIYWPGGGGHRMTMNSIVNRPLPNGRIRVDFMDPWTGEIEYGELDPSSGWLEDFESTSGNRGRLGNIIIVCPKEEDPSGGGGGGQQPGPDPDPIPVPLPHPGLYSLHVIVVDNSNHSARLIRVVEKRASEFGDAPEAALAYPSTCRQGAFPTCMNVGPAMWVRHFSSGQLFFGPKLDLEAEGNAGKCPLFNPNTYDQDECFQDGDAGLILPQAYTIVGPVGSEQVIPCPGVGGSPASIGTACTTAVWGRDIDIHVTNNLADDMVAYVNVLADWNKSGEWSGASACPPCSGAPGAVAPEHILVDFPIPAGFSGKLSTLNPPNFLIGPNGGYIWTRWTVTPNRMGQGWPGDGEFNDGETEDYLLHVKPVPQVIDCDWNEGDEHKMHYPQLPDLSPNGVDVDMFWTELADDFKCTQSGKITDIHFWGSFADDCLPAGGPGSLTFHVKIYDDIPAEESPTGYSMPGKLLWERVFGPCEYTVRQVADDVPEGWYDPATGLYQPANHSNAYQYNICINDEDVFEQEAGEVYWLEVKDVPEGEEPGYTFGWKTTKVDLHWNDDAVYRSPTGGWSELRYPDGHPYQGHTLDLAFVITGEEAPPPEVDWGDAPDPAYPTLAVNNGASHLIDLRIYMGNTVDPEADGQPTAAADGDDTDPDGDDEDGVTFDTPLVPGQMAQITVKASIAGAFISAWVDFGADGSWAQPEDYVVQSAMSVLGDNVFSFPVPNTAVVGQTYARVRFTTMPQIGFAGPAPNGEVEDYLVEIEPGYEPKPPVEHLKWSQPPIEIDPVVGRMPVYCGWDELAFSVKELATVPAYWQIVADDFRCIGSMPITSVHWWGSYAGWVGQEPPADPRPAYWQIGFWTNAPIGDLPFSMPEKLIWAVQVKPDRVEETWVGTDSFPDPERPPESCFQYFVRLRPEEYFWQADFIEENYGDTVFWISITPVYRGFPSPEYKWGWKTRPEHWMDDAVTFTAEGDELRPGYKPDPGTMAPIEDALVCGTPESYDVAFELDTDPNYIKWEQAFTGLRHWPHYEDEESMATEEIITTPATKYIQEPDISPTGIDVDATFALEPIFPPQLLADDFQCEKTGPVTDIHIWGSWRGDWLPFSEPGGVMGDPAQVLFTVSFHKDIPAGVEQPYSMPGEMLWLRQFGPGEFIVEQEPIMVPEGYYNPCMPFYEPQNHVMAWKYSFFVDPAEAFQQEEGNIYWLDIQAQPLDPNPEVRFGWKTAVEQRRDDAVWIVGTEPVEPPPAPWQPLTHPEEPGQSLDLAFELTTEAEEEPRLEIHRLVADDWQCTSGQPVTAAVWWGSYIGYQYKACECLTVPRPVKPAYFLLSIWTDVPAGVDRPYSHPGEKIWEYKAYDYDEVLVGFDKHPETSEPGSPDLGREAVFRYSVRLPEENWFYQEADADEAIYWFSVVAVYTESQPVVYPWGWTNHEHVFNDDAVAGLPDPTGTGEWIWEELFDQTGVSEDMSFVLFTEPDCFPRSYSTYPDWVALGKPNCWCGIYGNPPWPYQCDGDADGADSGFPFFYRVYTGDLSQLIANWKKKVGDPTLNPCADFDHKDSGFPFHYRVYTSDLSMLITNWKKKNSELPGNCPRPE